MTRYSSLFLVELGDLGFDHLILDLAEEDFADAERVA